MYEIPTQFHGNLLINIICWIKLCYYLIFKANNKFEIDYHVLYIFQSAAAVWNLIIMYV